MAKQFELKAAALNDLVTFFGPEKQGGITGQEITDAHPVDGILTITRAAKTLRNLDWFEVIETRGHLKDNKIAHWQVKIKVGFRMED